MDSGKRFVGGFIDQHDPVAVAEWSAGFCEGLDVNAAAERYGVEPTIAAVARHISEKFPADTREISFRACMETFEREASGK